MRERYLQDGTPTRAPSGRGPRHPQSVVASRARQAGKRKHPSGAVQWLLAPVHTGPTLRCSGPGADPWLLLGFPWLAACASRALRAQLRRSVSPFAIISRRPRAAERGPLGPCCEPPLSFWSRKGVRRLVAADGPESHGRPECAGDDMPVPHPQVKQAPGIRATVRLAQLGLVVLLLCVLLAWQGSHVRWTLARIRCRQTMLNLITLGAFMQRDSGAGKPLIAGPLSVMDAWGTPIQFTPADDRGRFTLTSAGSDRILSGKACADRDGCLTEYFDCDLILECVGVQPCEFRQSPEGWGSSPGYPLGAPTWGAWQGPIPVDVRRLRRH